MSELDHTQEPAKPTTEPSDSIVTVRVPQAIHDRFRELAAFHGRSVSEELKWAMVLFDQHTVLAEVVSQHDTAAVAEVQQDLAASLNAALCPPRESVALN